MCGALFLNCNMCEAWHLQLTNSLLIINSCNDISGFALKHCPPQERDGGIHKFFFGRKPSEFDKRRDLIQHALFDLKLKSHIFLLGSPIALTGSIHIFHCFPL